MRDLDMMVWNAKAGFEVYFHRTSTLPFLSMPLLTQLENPMRRFPYIIRFDLESCTYVFLWDVMFHPERRQTPRSRFRQTNALLDSWLSTDPEALCKDKFSLLKTLTEKYLPARGRRSEGVTSTSFQVLNDPQRTSECVNVRAYIVGLAYCKTDSTIPPQIGVTPSFVL